jgi:DNA replication initiation complex subunit (GINS family)
MRGRSNMCRQEAKFIDSLHNVIEEKKDFVY